jgi:hypothetical protein
VRHLRDVLTLAIGSALCLSQVILQFQGGEPSIILITAGVSLLAGYPLLKVGDRKADEG